MQKSIEVLMGEHRLIEEVLGSLETYAIDIRAGAPAVADVVGDYARFLAGFADACHHGKEEDILFMRLVERGFPYESGPLAVMYREHEMGRAHVRALSELAARPGLVDSPALLDHAESYVPLLRQHILKEDRILYPMALQVLTGPELDAMDSEFEAFESRMRGDGSHDRFRALAESLTQRFRPDEARMAAASQMAFCGR